MKVKVWNDNTHTDWNETFKGDKVTIKSGSFIEMEFYEAHEFKGQFSAIKILGDGTQDPKSFKMIRVDQKPAEGDIVEDGQEIFPCQMCKKVFTTESSLLKHSDAQHADQVVTDEHAERSIPKKKGRPFKTVEKSLE